MKKLLVIIFALGLMQNASAQAKINMGGGVRTYGTRTTVVRVVPVYPSYRMGMSMGLGMSRYGYGYSPFYSPFYDPFYNTPRPETTPSQLDLEIDDIKNDYSYKLATVRNDKSLSKQERKQKIRDLKHNREDAIIDTKKNYYKDNSNENSK